MASAKSNERISARIPENVYSTIAQAAALVGATMNQFLVQAALEKATTIIDKEHHINLSLKSAEIFFNALENPPEPSPSLINAIHNYNEKMKS